MGQYIFFHDIYVLFTNNIILHSQAYLNYFRLKIIWKDSKIRSFLKLGWLKFRVEIRPGEGHICNPGCRTQRFTHGDIRDGNCRLSNREPQNSKLNRGAELSTEIRGGWANQPVGVNTIHELGDEPRRRFGGGRAAVGRSRPTAAEHSRPDVKRYLTEKYPFKKKHTFLVIPFRRAGIILKYLGAKKSQKVLIL